MKNSLALEQNSELGNSIVFILIPFSTNKTSTVDFTSKDFSEWYTYSHENSKKHDSPYMLKQPEFNSLLKQLQDKDQEIYSESQFKEKPFIRGLIENVSYNNKKLFGIELKILVTYHTDGMGTIALIHSLPSMTIEEYLQTISELMKWNNQSINGVEYSNMQEYFEKGIFIKRQKRTYDSTISWGEEYPFFALGGSDKRIASASSFVENNKSFIYAVSHQDCNYEGWKRIREELLDSLLDRNLSRRKEYALYLTDVAMLEIDTDSRFEFIDKWAKRRNTSVENMRLKLLFERVQLLELLLTQRFILLDIDSDIQQYELSSKTPIHQLVSLNNKITFALSNYYYANAMTRQHVSGIEWVAYGQSRFHLEELVEHIKNRMELIEANQQIKNDFNNMRGNFIFQLISIILGSSAVVGIVDTLVQFPFFSGSWLANNVLLLKSIIYIIFVVGIVLLTIRYSKDR